jgi:hypothetical protein
MVNAFAFETEARTKQRDALDRATRERLAATCVTVQPADRDRPAAAATVAAPAGRRLVPRLVGFIPALRPRGTGTI